MKKAVNVSYLYKRPAGEPRRELAQAADICKSAGFDAIDYPLCETEPENNVILTPDYERRTAQARRIIEDCGLRTVQTHAPFVKEEYSRERYAQLLMLAVEASGILGAQTMVVHTDCWDRGDGEYDSARALDDAYNLFSPVVAAAGRIGLTVALENLFEPVPQAGRTRYASTFEELTAILRALDSPSVGICWDFGHGRIAFGEKQFEKLEQVGSNLRATHVHDNNFGRDQHLTPFLGGADWTAAAKTLKKIDYKDYFTFELGFSGLPDALAEQHLRLAYMTAQYIDSLA